ncbi:MAG: hypothetical protein M0P31_05225 [Solirubrobacteraceae bacterium]|nr:hypothetical protein [Solirubrobacteraceae bacterium]
MRSVAGGASPRPAADGPIEASAQAIADDPGGASARAIATGLVGVALIVVATCLVGWGAFQVARGPSECGDGVACPPGFVPGLLGLIAGFAVVAPLGMALAHRTVRRAIATGVTLVLLSAAAGVLVARFGTDPMTDATLATWIAAGLLIAPALPAALVALAPPGASEIASAGALDPGSFERLRKAASASATPDPSTPAASLDTLHAQLMRGLASGRIGRDDMDAAELRILELLELHAGGIIDDDALRTAIAALRRDTAT